MNNFRQKADNFVGGMLLIGCMPSFLILIAVIGIFRSCMGYDEISIDNSIMTRRYSYRRMYITDSLGNGFETLHYTTNAVSSARYDEIMSREHLWHSYNKLRAEAADHFGHDLINTDIYDFVEYAKTFDIDSADVRLVNVWAYGREYEKLYQRPHEDYPDGWRNGDDVEFGTLYLKESDVYSENFSYIQRYRYWGCSATSLADERYTHISQSDRLQHKR
ncbi:MAG: hypothetical protein SNJ29_12985 [Rikenellaceae bacterium]